LASGAGDPSNGNGDDIAEAQAKDAGVSRIAAPATAPSAGRLCMMISRNIGDIGSLLKQATGDSGRMALVAAEVRSVHPMKRKRSRPRASPTDRSESILRHNPKDRRDSGITVTVHSIDLICALSP
jgi:hypothetical protein